MARLQLTDDRREMIADVFPEPAAIGRPRERSTKSRGASTGRLSVRPAVRSGVLSGIRVPGASAVAVSVFSVCSEWTLVNNRVELSFFGNGTPRRQGVHHAGVDVVKDESDAPVAEPKVRTARMIAAK